MPKTNIHDLAKKGETLLLENELNNRPKRKDEVTDVSNLHANDTSHIDNIKCIVNSN